MAWQLKILSDYMISIISYRVEFVTIFLKQTIDAKERGFDRKLKFLEIKKIEIINWINLNCLLYLNDMGNRVN